VAHLSRAEELGFSGVWVTEQIIGTAPNLDPSVVLALAAAYTSRLRLGCAVGTERLAIESPVVHQLRNGDRELDHAHTPQ
jgi:alkanesulfonate monooxygenase SsuD/methylene tetrahydromethanopterin reductase-like flavin-dependent oxidoreductase (luciferase family)